MKRRRLNFPIKPVQRSGIKMCLMIVLATLHNISSKAFENPASRTVERFNRKFVPKYLQADFKARADPRGTLHPQPLQRRTFFRFSRNPRKSMMMCLLVFFVLICPVHAVHFPSVSGIYLLRKNVDVELLVLVRTLHLSKRMLVHEWERTRNDITPYTRLGRYIRLLSGVQALLHQANQNKSACHS